MPLRAFPALLAVLLLAASVLAQTEKISLWPSAAPGTEGRTHKEVVGDTGNISQVNQPELWFYPAPKGPGLAPALLVCPGGGYRNLVIQKEGVRVAEWFNKRGFAVFVLKYRLNPAEAVQDARRAMRVIRRNATAYGIDPAKLGVTGFSAGGHLSANLAFNHEVSDLADDTDALSARPEFCAPIYGVFNGLRLPSAKAIPPVFLVHAVDDKTVPVEHSLKLFTELKAKGVAVELHLYEQCGHGFAMDAHRGYASNWGEPFLLWLKAHGIEGRHPAQP